MNLTDDDQFQSIVMKSSPPPKQSSKRAINSGENKLDSQEPYEFSNNEQLEIGSDNENKLYKNIH